MGAQCGEEDAQREVGVLGEVLVWSGSPVGMPRQKLGGRYEVTGLELGE